ncbi:MAG: hypothetical protein AAGB24_06495 [Bacteroidota bacterium]
MKKPKIWIIAFAMIFTVACNFTEEIFLEEDGSGKISINFDGSELMEMGGDEMMQTDEKAIDSLISFKQLLEEKKDSIAALPSEEQAKLKKLEPFSLHMIMDPEEKVMKFDMFRKFERVDEVNDAFNAFQSASILGPSGGQNTPPSPMTSQNAASEVSYAFNKNTFTRTATVIDEALQQQSVDSLQGAEMFLSGSTYTLKYHFPRKVKSTTAEEATFSADGKTLIYEVKFLDLMKNPELLNLEVELEN